MQRLARAKHNVVFGQERDVDRHSHPHRVNRTAWTNQNRGAWKRFALEHPASKPSPDRIGDLEVLDQHLAGGGVEQVILLLATACLHVWCSFLLP
jgi:hypothetical protein